MKRPARFPTETAKCLGCGKPFVRLARGSRSRRFCDAEKCQKILKIKNSVAKFSDLSNVLSHVGPYAEIRRYEGGYTE